VDPRGRWRQKDTTKLANGLHIRGASSTWSRRVRCGWGPSRSRPACLRTRSRKAKGLPRQKPPPPLDTSIIFQCQRRYAKLHPE
jgi:hypothetical protein